MATGRSIGSQFKNLTVDNVGTWPILPRLVLWGFVVVFCAVLGYIFLWRDQTDQLDQLRAREDTLKVEFKSKLQQAINLDELRRQKDQVNQYVLTLEKQLPSKAEMDALLSDINQAGIGRGLQFELFRPGQTQLRDYYAELPIAVRVTGRYHDLGAFTSDIANLPRIVTLNNLNLQAITNGSNNTPTGVLSLDAVAKTFRYLDDEEIANQRKSRDAAKQGAKK
jgi:type IV pilus assembly protein PilO